jgi:general secretion pathway protein J
MTARDRNDSGFTLLEIIVALVVLGVLLATLSQGMHFGFASWGRQDQMLRTGEALQATDRTLRRLVEQADPGSERDGAKLTGRPHAMVFTSTLPIGHDGAPSAADISLMVDHDDRLVLSWLPHLHVQRLQPAPPPHISVLLNHIADLELSYWSDNTGQWSRDWHENTLPDLVRIRITFPEHDPRHWPDIVAVPARDQAPT